MLVKYALFFILVGLCQSVSSQDYNIENGISLTSENQTYSVTIAFESSVPVSSPYDRGTVTRYSTDPQNTTGMGRFVEVTYEMGFDFEESFVSQGTIKMIYSNLASIAVTEVSEIDLNSTIGWTGAGTNAPLRLFLISDTDQLTFLQMWTNDTAIEINGTWYWDASYLLGGQ